jgi:hypothetical protein
MLSRSATLPPTPTPTQVDGERQELTLEAPNGGPSALAGRAPDAGTDSVEQGQGDVAENTRGRPRQRMLPHCCGEQPDDAIDIDVDGFVPTLSEAYGDSFQGLLPCGSA